MGIRRMNHAVLYVRDARRQQQFYTDVLGFSTVVDDPDGAFVFMRGPDSDNHHDIAFFTIGAGAGASDAGSRTVGMYHIAWEVGSLDELAAARQRLQAAGGGRRHSPRRRLPRGSEASKGRSMVHLLHQAWNPNLDAVSRQGGTNGGTDARFGGSNGLFQRRTVGHGHVEGRYPADRRF